MLERACDVDGTDISAWEYLGNYLAKRDRLGEALVAFDRILALEPNSLYTNYNKAAVLFKLGRPGLARPYGKRALEIAPDSELAQELVEAMAE
jgi:tetratricopeptide (TPR) repeat protein